MPEMKPTLQELFKKAGISDSLSSTETKTLNQKLGKLDKVANAGEGVTLLPVGNGWHGTYRFYVDWNADGDYSDTNEEITGRFVGANVRRGLPGPDSFCAIPALIEIQVENTDDIFSATNTDSPLYSYINSSSKKRCKFTIDVNGTEYQQFDGWVKEVASNPTTHGRKVATVVVDDLVGRLKNIPMISFMDQNLQEVAVVAQILGLTQKTHYGVAKYGASYYGYSGVEADITATLATSLDTFTYSGDRWKESSTSALDALQDVAQSVLGYAFVDREGVATFRNRQYRPTNAGTSDWDCSLISRVDAVGLQDETTYNETQVLVSLPKAETAGSVVWTLRETPTIGPGESKTYVAGFSDPATGVPCGVIDGIRPEASTDYTDNVSFAVTVAWRAADAEVTVTNSGTSSLLLDFLQLRGTPIVRYDETVVKGGGSVVPRKTRWFDMPCQTNLVQSDSLVAWLYTLMSYLTNAPRQATIVLQSPADLEEVAQLDVDRRIEITPGNISYVNWVHHQISPGTHIVTVGLSPATLVEMWTLGTSELGISTTLGV